MHPLSLSLLCLRLMAFGDIETEEPCLHGIGQVVERVLDKVGDWKAKIVLPSPVLKIQVADKSLILTYMRLCSLRNGTGPRFSGLEGK